MQTKSVNVVEARISKLFIHYAMPGVIASLAMCMYGILNGIFLGRLVGVNALAAVNMASPVFNIISCFAILIAIGGNTLTAISLGNQDRKRANNYFNTAFFTLLFIAILIFVIVVFAPSSLARMLGANEVISHDVVLYMRTFGFFMIPIILNIFLGISMQSIGKPQLYMVGNLLSVVLNIVLDVLFIYYLKMGIFGAALASGLSALIVFILFISKFIRREGTLVIATFQLDLRAIGSMAYNGSSEAVTQFSAGSSMLIFQFLLIKRFGEVGISAFAVVQYISLVINAVLIGMTRGLGSVISINYGANQLARIKELIILTIKVVLIVGILCVAVLLLLKSELISVFVQNNTEVTTFAEEILFFYSFNFIFVGINMLMSAFYTAIHNSRTSVIVAVIRYVFLIGCFYVLPTLMGRIGLWLSFASAELLCLVVCWLYFRRTMKLWELR